jgi:hypothetical protein
LNSSAEFEQAKRAGTASTEIKKQLKPGWFYVTKKREVAAVDAKDARKESKDAPKWFKQSRSIASLPPTDKVNRSLGSSASAANLDTKPRGNLRVVSHDAPKWMHVKAKAPPPKPLVKIIGNPSMRKDQNRTFFVNPEQPPKCAFNIGDFRHNVWNSPAIPPTVQKDRYKNILEWNSGDSKVSTAVTEKVGSVSTSFM